VACVPTELGTRVIEVVSQDEEDARIRGGLLESTVPFIITDAYVSQ
jgi:hypothetical protein